jgi:hypothetical protein
MKSYCAKADAEKEGRYYVLSGNSAFVDQPGALMFDRDAIESLRLRNQSSRTLPVFEACQGYRSAAQSDIDNSMGLLPRPPGILKSDVWSGFYKSFPGAKGIIYLSFPGYSKDGESAIVQVASACESFCGHGFYKVLRKLEGKWVLEKSIPAWEN